MLAVPNVSAGADLEAVGRIEAGLGAEPVALLDQHSDAVHNRTVFTIAGRDAPELGVGALLAWEARSRAGNPSPGTATALGPLAGMTPDEAIGIIRSVLAKLPAGPAHYPALRARLRELVAERPRGADGPR